MKPAYDALVEATVDMMNRGGLHRVPLDQLTKADGLGFTVETFENDVLAALEDRRAEPDPSQHRFLFPKGA